MAKNYNPWILFVGFLLFTFNYSYSQAITFNGERSDFDDSQKITGDATVDYYVSFDEVTQTLYFGAFRTSGIFAPEDEFTIYIDSDPQPDLTSGGGSTVGQTRYERTPILPFSADQKFTIRNTTATSGASQISYDTFGWATTKNITSDNRHVNTTALEIAINISDLAVSFIPKGIYFSMFMARNAAAGTDGYYGYSDPEYPISFDGNTSTGYFGGIGITSKVTNPTHHSERSIQILQLGSSPIPGVKYAHMELSAGYKVVAGNLELVEGGSAIIRPNSTLTVEGIFTNNGLITFESTAAQFSGLIANSVVGSGSAEYHRHVNQAASNESTTGQNDLISAPLTGQPFGEFAATNNDKLVPHPTRPAEKGFAPFDKTTGTYKNYTTALNAETPLTAGVGYRTGRATTSPNTTFTFTGKINTGDITVPIATTSNDVSMWSLIGNPYPSYINIGRLLTLNQSVFETSYGAIYAYNGNPEASGNNIDRWVTLNFLEAGESHIAPGQGFYIASKATAENINFSPDLRMLSHGDDFIKNRAAAEIDNVSLRLTISKSSTIRHTDIYFHTNATLDNDFGYDSGQFGDAPFTIFSKLIEDAENLNIPLGIQALPYSILESEISVPIGIKAAEGEQITISAINTPTPRPLPEAVEVYFEDMVTGISTLLNTSTLPHNHHYIFTPSTNLTGEMGRFFLRFTNKSLSVSNPDFDALDVYSPLNTGNLIVRGSVNEVSSLEIFDLNGRLLQTFSVQPHQAVNRFEVSKLASGIYIVKLNNKTQSKIKKIQLNNKL